MNSRTKLARAIAILNFILMIPVAFGADATKAVAVLHPTQGNSAEGKVTFVQEGNIVEINTQISGLPPGSIHGFHIHEKGDCSAPDGSSAGGHLNLTQKNHGSPSAEDRHTGDLGNVTSNSSGTVNFTVSDSVIKLQGEGSIVGHSVILHAQPDDMMTQPTGNAGARIACGVIEKASS